jgi:hypothetical protein
MIINRVNQLFKRRICNQAKGPFDSSDIVPLSFKAEQGVVLALI